LLDSELVVVMGPDRERANLFAQRMGFSRCTDDVAAVLTASDVDAVVVASPSPVHAHQAEAALRSGKHVLCEVPLGLALTEVENVYSALPEDNSLVCMVCHTRRYISEIAQLHVEVVEGAFEPLNLILITGLARRHNTGWTGSVRDWTDNVLWHHGAHAVDTALLLLDNEVDTILSIAGPPHPVSGLPMDLSISLRTTSGRLATMVLSYNALSPVNELIAIGRNSVRHIRDWARVDPDNKIEIDSSRDVLSAAILEQDRVFLKNVTSSQREGPTIASTLNIYRLLQVVQDGFNKK
jgi:2-hydroxy-4-carboxymuconate semialdehyde hemiacetal dehydrogenase